MSLKSIYIFLLLISPGMYVKAQNDTEIAESYGQNRFINKVPFEVKDSVVCFFLRGNAAAKRVILSGSFCNWSTEALAMQQTDSGWIAFVKLAAGKHFYKFIIDDSWEIDEDNLLIEKTDQGYFNSIYYKTNFLFTLEGFLKTKKVWLAASFNSWRKDELSLSKTASGWQIPLYLSDGTYEYKFRIDNEWLDGSKNKKGTRKEPHIVYNTITVGLRNTTKDLSYYQNQLAIDEIRGDKFKIAIDLGNIGDAYLATGRFQNAAKTFERGLLIYEQMKNFDSVGALSLKTALAYKGLSDFPHLLEYVQKSIRSFEKAGNELSLARALREMGYYYLNLSHYPSAPQYFLKALELYSRLNQLTNKAKLLGDLGHTYLLLNESDKGLSYMQEALKLNQQIGNKSGMGSNLWILGGYYLGRSANVPLALDCYKKALELFDETGDKVKAAHVFFALADLYVITPDSLLIAAGLDINQKYFSSIGFRKKGYELIRYTEPESEHLTLLFELSKTFEQVGLYDSAYHYFKVYISIRDRVAGTEKQKDVVRLETKYEYEKKQDSLHAQQDLMDEKLQKQLLLYQQQQQQLALNQSQLALSYKEKDLQHLANLKMQADLQNEQLTKQQKEKENQLQSAQVKTLTQEKAINKLSQQRQWLYIIGGSVLLILASLYFIYRFRLHGARLESELLKEKAEQEQKETAFQHKLADVSMSALRSQMNPHFIFNCLNSIKLYTAQNNSVAASEYLTKFSKLIRLILENSRNERITLSSELTALKLYIEMEAMRFKEKLTYSLSVEKNVESDYIEIPPLLLQPYVENAIWHGLMPRENGGHITITVSIQEEKSLLEININDNGIGRAAATSLNYKTASKHRSYGMKATTERIALINQIYKAGANVFVHDLVNEEGEAAGTQVTIQIPV
jgi:tetratricopeptide (TPR) repeat protein